MPGPGTPLPVISVTGRSLQGSSVSWNTPPSSRRPPVGISRVWEAGRSETAAAFYRGICSLPPFQISCTGSARLITGQKVQRVTSTLQPSVQGADCISGSAEKPGFRICHSLSAELLRVSCPGSAPCQYQCRTEACIRTPAAFGKPASLHSQRDQSRERNGMNRVAEAACQHMAGCIRSRPRWPRPGLPQATITASDSYSSRCLSSVTET